MKKLNANKSITFARLKFASSNVLKCNRWQKLIFTGEEKFNLVGPNDLRNYWQDIKRKPHLILIPAQDYGLVVI